MLTDEEKLQYLYDHSTVTSEGCRIWNLCKDEKGYGIMAFRQENRKYKTFAAHREMFRLHNKCELTQQILHHCDNKSCINPLHLYQGSHADNVKDAITRRRYKSGNSHYNSVMTEEQANHVITCYKSGQRLCDIARMTGIEYGVVKHAAYGKTWKHLHSV